MELIKSISYDQQEILPWIMRLYLNGQPFDVDATYSTGSFYRNGIVPHPRCCFDIRPQAAGCEQADCRSLPLPDSSIRSLILDPPFQATAGNSLKTDEGNKILRRFGVYPSEEALQALYQDAILEAHRMLGQDGILVIKCQDKVSSGKQYMMYCFIYDWAVDAGFEPVDLLVADWQRNQKHSRKFHSYFWVFRKRGGRL